MTAAPYRPLGIKPLIDGSEQVERMRAGLAPEAHLKALIGSFMAVYADAEHDGASGVPVISPTATSPASARTPTSGKRCCARCAPATCLRWGCRDPTKSPTTPWWPRWCR